MISLSWLFRGNGTFVNDTKPIVVQLLSLVLFLGFVWLATKGLNALKKLGNIAGILLLVMSFLFIILKTKRRRVRSNHNRPSYFIIYAIHRIFRYTFFSS